MDFLDEDNLCGWCLLRIVSRANAIIAELLRLSDHIPPVFQGKTDPQQPRYGEVLFDFQYLKRPEDFEKAVTASDELMDIDEEFQENHMAILERFYQLFESIYKYIVDLNKYLEDLQSGFYIQHSIEGILLDTDGRQLLCEALYLYGVMLILLDARIEGPVRERMIVTYYRYKGSATVRNFEEVCRLC